MKSVPVTVAVLLTLSLVSCSTGSKDESKGKSAGEVMTGYAQTLSKAPDKAKAAVQLENERNASQDAAMKELDK